MKNLYWGFVIAGGLFSLTADWGGVAASFAGAIMVRLGPPSPPTP